MRIIGGELKGRGLKVPKTQDIRPSSDRLRESLFNILHSNYEPLDGKRVLDLFAGTGALGLEAVSRGANFAALVDMGIEARGLMRENIENLGLAQKVQLLKRDATKLGNVSPFKPFDVVFCDPPYNKQLAQKALESASNGGWLAPNCLIIVEEATKAGFTAPPQFEIQDTRIMGDTTLYFLSL